MIFDKYKTIKDEDKTKDNKMHETIRKRSLSGSDQRMKVDFRGDKLKELYKPDNDDSTDSIRSELDYSIHSASSSSGINALDTCLSNHSDKILNYHSDHSKKHHYVSAKSKIKHFLAEHIGKTHTDISIVKSKNSSSIGPDLQESSFQANTDISSWQEVSYPKLHVHKDNNLIESQVSMTSEVLDRIRHINIYTPNDSDGNSLGNNNYNEVLKGEVTVSSNEMNTDNNFPFPEPNPFNLPQVVCTSSINFSPNQIINTKHKKRLPHSISFDPDYRYTDIPKHLDMKTLNKVMSVGPEKDKWEKKISDYLDTSTPTGATLIAINFGLKRVTETDKFLMITKSSTSCLNEFLEDGISHVNATSDIYQSLMRHSTCYDVMPDSGKVIILDSQMQIGRAFDAIESNIVRAAPIWSSEKQTFIALLSVDDLVPLLLHLHQKLTGTDHCCEEESSLKDFSTITVEKCLNIIPRFRTLQNHIVQVTPETDLHSVNTMFNKLHKSMVLVIDSYLSGNPLFLLSGLRTLTYLFFKAHTVSLDSCFSTKINSSTLLQEQHFEILKPISPSESPCQTLTLSKVGRNQYLIYPSSSIIDILRAMAQSYYCCGLIIEEKFRNEDISHPEYTVIGVITMTDIINLVKIQKHIDGTITANHILQYRDHLNEPFTYRDPVVHCDETDSIQNLINIIIKEMASFVLIHSANNNRKTTLGILCAHDILSYIDGLSCNTNKKYFNIANFHINKHEKNNPNHNTLLVDNVRSNLDNFSPMSYTSTKFDDFEEES